MKFSEKLGYLLQGKTEEEIAAIEAEEQKQQEEEKKNLDENSRLRSSLEEAASMVKSLEDELQNTKEALRSKEDELTKLNEQFALLNNKQTIKDQPEKKETAADVFNQLFNKKKEES